MLQNTPAFKQYFSSAHFGSLPPSEHTNLKTSFGRHQLLLPGKGVEGWGDELAGWAVAEKQAHYHAVELLFHNALLGYTLQTICIA